MSVKHSWYFLVLVALLNEEKSVIKAALFSAVIPGSGQYYGGSVWKAILFAGIEVAGWTVYIVNTSKGEDQETEMETFANTHWSEQKYWSKISACISL